MFKFVYTLDRKLHTTRSLLVKEIKGSINHRCNNVDLIVSCILNNITDALRSGDYKFYVTLNKSSYNHQIVNGVKTPIPFSYKAFIMVLSAMEALGYVELSKGGRVYKYDHKDRISGGTGLVIESINHSYAHITEKFRRILPEKLDIGFRKLDNVILLRDEYKKEVEFSIPKSIRTKKTSVDSYNNAVRYSSIKDRHGFTYDCQVRKIFNNHNFKIGGRSYMSNEGIQSLSKEERRSLTIEDRNTVIYDFVAFETSIAYTLSGIKVEGDPYMQVVLDGYPPELNRYINKLMLNTLFNCNEDDDVAAIVGYNLSKEYDIAKLYEEGMIPDQVVPLRHLLILFEDAYDGISDYFYCGKENEITRIGSEIMDYIIDFFIQRGDIALPVFDEVICAETLEEELHTAMRLGWEHVLGSNLNFNIRKEK